ncbi:MAG: hypothetical protein JXQ82_09115 [Methanomicrobiaceae archaeon]|nr:hypothetical protein [Methanomicrobiaceae archaeon]
MKLLKTVLLTTDTSHHLYYASVINETFPWAAILAETKKIKPPFETDHPFEKIRDDYEKDVLLKGKEQRFAEISHTEIYNDLNSDEAMSSLKAISPDLIIVFGTGKIDPRIISTAKLGCLNLHGGNPEHYRGLDTHMWAIYHSDFNNLVTTLHHLDSTLDTGDLIFQAQLPLTKDTKIYQIRSINTEICVEISIIALHVINSGKKLPCRKQVSTGRYYSFMPGILKDECVRKFEGYVADL